MDRMRNCLKVMLAVAVVCPPALANESADKFTFAKLVPADSMVYIHGVHNPEREFLEKHWSHVWEALKSSGIDTDIKTLVKRRYHLEEEETDFDVKWNRAVELCKGVHWGDLAHHEMVMFMESFEEFAFLFRPKQATLDANVRGLVAILEEFASLKGMVELHQASAHGGQIWRVGGGDNPLGLTLFHRGEVVGLSFSSTTAENLLAGLAGEKKTAALIDTPRYRQAMSNLPKPEDAVMFVDMKKLFASMKRLAGAEAGHGGENGPQVDPQVRFLNNLLSEVDFVDFIAFTEQTDGLRTITHSVTQIAEGGRAKKLCKAFADQKPLTGVLEHVPAGATGYGAWSGMDLGTLYSLVKDVIERNLDEGPNRLARWAEWQQNHEFNLQDDVLSWLDGRMIWMTFPAAIQTGFGGSDFVCKIKVHDDAKARESINRQADRFSESLLTAPAADVEAEGFRSVTHPMLAMFLKLTYGVKDGWLYLGNSSAAINQCLATAAGKAPSFATNERFKGEGLAPNGPVSFASFADTSNAGSELAMVFGMTMPMAAAMIPPSPETELMRTVFAMLGKLAPVFMKMNFERSRSSLSRLEGDRWLTQDVVNYKEYKPPKQVPDLAETRREEKKVKQQLEGL